MTGRRVAAEGGCGRLSQGLVCMPGFGLVIVHKERGVTAGEIDRAPW